MGSPPRSPSLSFKPELGCSLLLQQSPHLTEPGGQNLYLKQEGHRRLAVFRLGALSGSLLTHTNNIRQANGFVILLNEVLRQYDIAISYQSFKRFELPKLIAPNP